VKKNNVEENYRVEIIIFADGDDNATGNREYLAGRWLSGEGFKKLPRNQFRGSVD